MNLFENIKMAIDSILSNKMRSFLTMLGIIIGISSVISIVSLGVGGQNTITGEFEKIGVSTIRITVKSAEAETSDYITYKDIEQLKEKIGYIKYAAPITYQTGIASSEKKSRTAMLYGTNEDIHYIDNVELLYGRFFNNIEFEEGRAVIVIDETAAKSFFGTSDVVGETINVGSNTSTKKAKIIGVTKSQLEMFSNMMDEEMPVIIYLPATYLDILYSRQSKISELYIMADSKDNTEAAGILAQNMLINRHGNRDRDVYKVESLMKQLEQINTIVGIFTAFIAAVAAISLLVGGVGVMNIMLVSVTERTREIGIRKAIGAKTSNIMFQFLTESVIISCIGGIIGLIFGIGGAYLLGQLAGITPSVTPQIVIISIAFSSVVGIFFGIYPARKAAKLDPIDALRYE
ncbi:MAG: FtsX-like permease family protein [Clostridiaceae bacterium]|jgi:putative ABC transport system permease protein|nr:FtsX-like permease family protein [Clostridiaceae bacterium]